MSFIDSGWQPGSCRAVHVTFGHDKLGDEIGATMIYAIRKDGTIRTLVELTSRKDLDPRTVAVRAKYAHKWVRDGKLHETGLFIENGRVCYADSQC